MTTYNDERELAWTQYLLHIGKEHPNWPVLPCHDAFFEGFKAGTVAVLYHEVATFTYCAYCGEDYAEPLINDACDKCAHKISLAKTQTSPASP